MTEMLCRGTILAGLQAGRPCGYRARPGSAFCKHHEPEPIDRSSDPLIEMLDLLRLHGRLDAEEANALERAARDSRPVGEGLDVERLAAEWEASADRTMERALVGDPSAAMARAKALRSCADALRSLQAGPAAVRPATEAEPPAKSDADGAERGARHRFAEASAAWNATLFRGVSHNWPEAAVRPVEREGAE